MPRMPKPPGTRMPSIVGEDRVDLLGRERLGVHPVDVDLVVVVRCRRGRAPRRPTGTRPAAARTCRPARCRPSRSAPRRCVDELLPLRHVELPALEAEPVDDHLVEALLATGAAAPRRWTARRWRRRPRRGRRRRTARSCGGCASSIGRSERHTMKSGGMPMLRSSLTECCVGFVLSSDGRGDLRHERDVDVADVLAAEVLLQLADRPRGTAATRCRRPCRRPR